MNCANFTKHAPPWTIGRKDQVLIVISKVFGARIRWPAGKFGVVDLKKLLRYPCRGGDNHMDEPHFKMHEGAVNSGHGGDGLVRFLAHVGEVSDYWPWFWARR